MDNNKRIKELTDEDVVRFARLHVTEGGSSTYTEQVYDTQLSIERGVIWLIHQVDWQMAGGSQIQDPSANSYESVKAQILRESKSSIVNINDADLIDMFLWNLQRTAAIGTDAGPLWFINEWPVVHKYPIPIPYAAQNIYLGLIGSNSLGGQTIFARIHYTIRAVSDAYFYRVAQALVG